MYLDKARIKQSFAAASVTYDSVAGLQRTVGKELLRSIDVNKVDRNFIGFRLRHRFFNGRVVGTLES